MLFTRWLSYALIRAPDHSRLELRQLEKKGEADGEADSEVDVKAAPLMYFYSSTTSPSQLDQISYSPHLNPPSRQTPVFKRLPIRHGVILR
jgi:hypothetical protein